MEWGTIAAQSTVVLFLCGIFKYVILNPLDRSIKSLQKMLEAMRDEEKQREEKRQAMDLRLARAEESIKSAHHRVDQIISERR